MKTDRTPFLRALAPAFCLGIALPGQAWSDEAEVTPSALVIESIECRGNETTDCGLILGEVHLAPGDKVDEEEIQNAGIRHRVRSLFEDAQLRLEKGSERDFMVSALRATDGNISRAADSLGIEKREFFN